MRVDSNHGTDRRGVNLVGLRVGELGWLFREQQVSDFGIDAHLEVVDDSADATGRLPAVQIKSGPSFFRYTTDTGWWFPCTTAHADYWRGHSLPVVIALVDPKTQLVYWQHVNSEHQLVEGPAACEVQPYLAGGALPGDRAPAGPRIHV
jgi:hypothetical protein